MSSDLGSRFSKRRRIAIIVTLGLLTGLGPFTIDLYLPAFPSLKGDLGITDAQVQATARGDHCRMGIGKTIDSTVAEDLRTHRCRPVLQGCLAVDEIAQHRPEDRIIRLPGQPSVGEIIHGPPV